MSPAALVSKSCEQERSVFRVIPPVSTARPFKDEVAVALRRVVETPPAKVLVAVVVATMEPTFNPFDEVAVNRVPSKTMMPFRGNAVWLVPPLAMSRVPAKFSRLSTTKSKVLSAS